MEKIDKKERDFLIIVYGCLKGSTFLKKTPSYLLLELKNRILEREKFKAERLEKFESYNDDYENVYGYHFNNKNFKNELMDGYDYDKDPDQQNEDFWT